jgi:hypothetical protein
MKRMVRSCFNPAAVCLCLSFAHLAMAQDSRVMGHITDAGDSAVSTAIVTATQVDSGWKRQVLSNAQGYYQLAPLPPGTYRIEAVKPGFKPLAHTGVGLAPGIAATVDLRMEDAEVSETTALQARKTGSGFPLAYLQLFLP